MSVHLEYKRYCSHPDRYANNEYRILRNNMYSDANLRKNTHLNSAYNDNFSCTHIFNFAMGKMNNRNSEISKNPHGSINNEPS